MSDTEVSRTESPLSVILPIPPPPTQLSQVDVIVKALTKQFSDGFSTGQLFLATTAAMKLVDGLNEDGPTKRDIVVRALSKLVDQLVKDSGAKAMLKTAIDMYVPGVIDSIVSAAKGKILNRKRGKKWRCC